jgi:hypothetical protein
MTTHDQQNETRKPPRSATIPARRFSENLNEAQDAGLGLYEFFIAARRRAHAGAMRTLMPAPLQIRRYDR